MAKGFDLLQRIGFWGVVLFLALYSAIPFYWAINTSLKTPAEVNAVPTTVVPEAPTIQNYISMITNSAFTRSILNSAIVAISVTLLSVVIGGLAAYALGRFQFRGRGVMRYLLMLMSLFPTIAVLPSLFDMVTDLGFTGSIVSLIITYPIFTLPMTTMPMIVFFRGLPPDIEQAAYVDGATTFQLFYRILLPIAMPVILTTGLITFVGVWSEYLLAITFTSAPAEARTIAAEIKFLSGSISAPQLMAGAVILSIPLVAVIAFIQRHFLRNTTEGAVKG